MRTTLIALLAITSATLVMYSQETGNTSTQETVAETAATAATLPATRTITDLKGRSMVGTILSKTETAITFVRASDQKKFEIALDTLSEADRTFIAGLVAPPVKKPRVLYIGSHGTGDAATNDLIIGKLKTAGFDTHTELSVDSKDAAGRRTAIWPGVDNMSDDRIKSFDVIWEECGNRTRLLAIFPTYKGVMVIKSAGNHSLKDFLKNQLGSVYSSKPYTKVNDNLIRYDNRITTWVSQTSSEKLGPIQPEFIDNAIGELQTLLKGPYPPK